MAFITRRTYKARLPDGRVVTRKYAHYTIQYHDQGGRIRRVKGFPATRDGLKATQQQLAELEIRLRWSGLGLKNPLENPYKDHSDRPLTAHVADWLADRRAEGVSDKYLDTAEKRLTILIDACGWHRLCDVEPNSFIRWRGRQKRARRNGTRKDLKGTGATTLNQYLDTVRALINWCVDKKRLASNALASIDHVEGPRRRTRRALDDAQVAALLAKAPEERKLVYRVGMALGLRRDELRKLQWGDLRLRSTWPHVQLRAEATKARRGDRVPVPQSLADDLRKHRPDGADDADPVFPRVPSLVWWKKDLKAAGIAYLDKSGRQLDFHAGTRKTLCTRMHRGGVPLATAMRVMRHTDAKLTMVDYADDVQLLGDALPEIAAAATTAPAPTTVAASGA